MTSPAFFFLPVYLSFSPFIPLFQPRSREFTVKRPKSGNKKLCSSAAMLCLHNSFYSVQRSTVWHDIHTPNHTYISHTWHRTSMSAATRAAASSLAFASAASLYILPPPKPALKGVQQGAYIFASWYTELCNHLVVSISKSAMHLHKTLHTHTHLLRIQHRSIHCKIIACALHDHTLSLTMAVSEREERRKTMQVETNPPQIKKKPLWFWVPSKLVHTKGGINDVNQKVCRLGIRRCVG